MPTLKDWNSTTPQFTFILVPPVFHDSLGDSQFFAFARFFIEEVVLRVLLKLFSNFLLLETEELATQKGSYVLFVPIPNVVWTYPGVEDILDIPLVASHIIFHWRRPHSATRPLLYSPHILLRIYISTPQIFLD